MSNEYCRRSIPLTIRGNNRGNADFPPTGRRTGLPIADLPLRDPASKRGVNPAPYCSTRRLSLLRQPLNSGFGRHVRAVERR